MKKKSKLFLAKKIGKKVLDINDVSDLLGLSLKTIYNYIKEEKLKPHYTSNNKMYFIEEDIQL